MRLSLRLSAALAVSGGLAGLAMGEPSAIAPLLLGLVVGVFSGARR